MAPIKFSWPRAAIFLTALTVSLIVAQCRRATAGPTVKDYLTVQRQASGQGQTPRSMHRMPPRPITFSVMEIQEAWGVNQTSSTANQTSLVTKSGQLGGELVRLRAKVAALEKRLAALESRCKCGWSVESKPVAGPKPKFTPVGHEPAPKGKRWVQKNVRVRHCYPTHCEYVWETRWVLVGN